MNIKGIVPVLTGDNWFVMDKTGKFSLDTSVWADIYLIGGGCDGSDGYYEPRKKVVHGGIGGDGGFVCQIGKVALFKNIDYFIQVAAVNDKTGTNITIRGKKYSCGGNKRTIRKGGLESMINSRKAVVNSRDGAIGVLTPIGYVGSSGGGGCAVFKDFAASFGKGGYGAGNGRGYCPPDVSDEVRGNIQSEINAKNYGCGGGGNPYFFGCKREDIGLKSKGMGGCVIVLCTPYDDNFPNLTVKYWNKVGVNPLVDKNTREMVEMLQSKYYDTLRQNRELKDKLKKLEDNNDDT